MVTAPPAVRPGHDAPAAAAQPSVRRATALSFVFIGAGTALGFARDLIMAHAFGAGNGTDAFLVGWTIPETASPLLIEDAMALLMVPLMTRALRDQGTARAVVRRLLPRLVLGLAAAVALIMLGAPLLVHVLAPGLTAPAGAVTCVRLTALTVLSFGVAGFMAATLRAHGSFTPPAAIYLAYNVGIVGTILLLHGTLGISSAALGVAVGSVLMVAVQAPSFARRLRSTGPSTAAAAAMPLGLMAVVPIVAFTVTRQAQVFVERFLGSHLAPGSISHLNYAQKVGQVPMVLSLLIVTVTFPRLARIAGGDRRALRRRIEGDAVLVSTVVLAAAAYLAAFAPEVITLLFRHGRFSAADAGLTAHILRLYVLGLWGQSMVGVCSRVYFAGGRPVWVPFRMVGAGLAATTVVAVALVGAAGAPALAVANAAGITIAAVLLLAGVRRDVAPLRWDPLGRDLARLALAAAAACLAGWLTAHTLAALSTTGAPVLVTLLAGAVVVPAVFALVTFVSLRPRPRFRALPTLAGCREDGRREEDRGEGP